MPVIPGLLGKFAGMELTLFFKSNSYGAKEVSVVFITLLWQNDVIKACRKYIE